MTKKSTIRKDNDIVRRDHLARLKAGPAAIAHLVRTEDGSKAERRNLTDEVAEIGRQNRLEATGKAIRRSGRGKSRKDTVAERHNV